MCKLAARLELRDLEDNQVFLCVGVHGPAKQWHCVSISVNKVLLGENSEQARGGGVWAIK